MTPAPTCRAGPRTAAAFRLALCLALLIAAFGPSAVGGREIIVEDVSNPSGDHEIVPSIGRSGDDDRDDEQEEEEQGERRARQMREIIVEDVSNPGKHDEVVPSIGRSGDDDRDQQNEEEEEEMKEVEDWSPFGYRRLQDMPGGVLDPDVLANWINPPDSDDPNAWKKDMEEMMTLLQEAVEREVNSTIEAHVGADGRVEETGTWTNIINRLSASPDKLFPLCSPVGVVTRMHLLCPIIVISARMIIRGPPDFYRLTDEHHCINPSHQLPRPLEELSEKEDGTPMPFIIDKEIVERERDTLAWYCRHIMNMYAYVFKYVDDIVLDQGRDHKTLRPMVPVGWGHQNLYFVRMPSGSVFPIGQSIVKNDNLVVIFRGTMLPGEWVIDYTFPWADKKATEAVGIPGRVHRGFFNLASQFFAEFTKEVDLHGINSVTFTGHSLGGAIAQLAAVVFTKHHYHLKINCVTFGSPQVGDREFTDYMNRKVNLRRVAYLGSGQLDIPEEHHTVYGFGDIVTQMPVACEGLSLPACPGLTFAPDTEGLGSFTYAMAAGNIPIYAHDLKNTEGWLKKENYIFAAREIQDIPDGIMSSHICSYQCWSSIATGDPDDRCFFPGDPGADPRYLCDVNFEDSLLKRYPNVKLPPMDVITGQNVANQSVGGLPADMQDLLRQMPQQRKLRSAKN